MRTTTTGTIQEWDDGAGWGIQAAIPGDTRGVVIREGGIRASKTIVRMGRRFFSALLRRQGDGTSRRRRRIPWTIFTPRSLKNCELSSCLAIRLLRISPPGIIRSTWLPRRRICRFKLGQGITQASEGLVATI